MMLQFRQLLARLRVAPQRAELSRLPADLHSTVLSPRFQHLI